MEHLAYEEFDEYVDAIQDADIRILLGNLVEPKWVWSDRLGAEVNLTSLTLGDWPNHRGCINEWHLEMPQVIDMK
jgi:hypothetical protein